MGKTSSTMLSTRLYTCQTHIKPAGRRHSCLDQGVWVMNQIHIHDRLRNVSSVSLSTPPPTPTPTPPTPPTPPTNKPRERLFSSPMLVRYVYRSPTARVMEPQLTPAVSGSGHAGKQINSFDVVTHMHEVRLHKRLLVRCSSPNTSRRFALGTRDVCLVGENPTCSVPAL